jgi:peptidyl-prolyl cis-trans isomerase C
MTTGCGCGGGGAGGGGCSSSAKAVDVVVPEVEVADEPQLIASSEQEWPIVSVNGVVITPEKHGPGVAISPG